MKAIHLATLLACAAMPVAAGAQTAPDAPAEAEATGVTPHQYVMKARRDRAQELLAGSDMTIAQVGDALGFASRGHFTRAFRAHTGQTPGAWRMTAVP